MAKQRIHISHSSKGWALKREGSKVGAEVYPTKSKAIAAAERLAKKNDINLILVDERSQKDTRSSRTVGRSPVTGRFSTTTARRSAPGKSTKASSTGARTVTGAKRAPVDAKKLSPKEKARQWREWVESHKSTAPPLSDEAISRESIYEDRG